VPTLCLPSVSDTDTCPAPCCALHVLGTFLVSRLSTLQQARAAWFSESPLTTLGWCPQSSDLHTALLHQSTATSAAHCDLAHRLGADRPLATVLSRPEPPRTHVGPHDQLSCRSRCCTTLGLSTRDCIPRRHPSLRSAARPGAYQHHHPILDRQTLSQPGP
jgi:hypothetical protein